MRLDDPVRPEAKFGQRLVRERTADGAFWHDNNCLLEPLVVHLVERDEHERAALARRGRGLDQQILLAPHLIGALLHGAHAKRICVRGRACARKSDGDGGNAGHIHIQAPLDFLRAVFSFGALAIIFV